MTPVLIVGAGPTGLVLALWLTRLGIGVRIIDRAAEPGTASRAVGVASRTLEFHRQVGLAQDAVSDGVQVAAVNLWALGVRAARLPLGRMGEGLTPFPFVLMYPQDRHERLLVDRLAALGVTVERDTRLVDFTQDDAGVMARIQGPTGPQDLRAAYLAGCDGARSAVRESLGTGFAGGTYAQVFYVADVVARGAAADQEVHVDLEDADFLAVFPLKGEGRLRLIGAVRPDAARAERPLTFEDVGERAIADLGLAVDKVNWFSTYHVHHRVASAFRKGRAFLLGDAAHIHSPVGGQGMNTGIGDAVNLAWKLAAVLSKGADARLLDTYEPERIAFAQRLVATTDRAFTLVTAQGAWAGFVRTRLVPVIAPLLLKIAALRKLAFLTVSQLAVSYPQSPLSEGRAGRLRGGDRLPWVTTEAGGDNFTPLGALAWQVHVYGQAPQGLAAACVTLDLPLEVFAWRAPMHAAGLMQNAAYLVRPDGYIALADPAGDPQALKAYWKNRRLG